MLNEDSAKQIIHSVHNQKIDEFHSKWTDIKARYDMGEHLRNLGRLQSLISERPLVLWGAGNLGSHAFGYCNKNNLNVECFVDAYKTGVYRGCPIISPEDLVAKYPNALVVLCAGNDEQKNSIQTMLEDMGMSECCVELTPHMRGFHFGIPSYEDIVKHLDDYAWLYSVFEDSLSKEVLLDYIRMALLDVPMKRTELNNGYFSTDIVELSDDEVFVDCGCWIGDTVEEFVNRTEGKYKHIYSFEPNLALYEKAKQNLSKYDYVDLISKGLWNSETELKFNVEGETGSSSFVFGEGTVTVPVTSLDKFFDGKSDSGLPTFIKMDIEGAEKEALLGAERVICKCKPKLAISVYHRPGDIYELTRLINGFNPNYRFALRHYGVGMTDTVCYAV